MQQSPPISIRLDMKEYCIAIDHDTLGEFGEEYIFGPLDTTLLDCYNSRRFEEVGDDVILADYDSLPVAMEFRKRLAKGSSIPESKIKILKKTVSLEPAE